MSKGNEESSHNYSETYLDDGWKKCYVSKGCSQGYGYKVDDENPICIPLEQVNGVEEPKIVLLTPTIDTILDLLPMDFEINIFGFLLPFF